MNPDIAAIWLQKVAEALAFAVGQAMWSDKEAAAKVGVDPAEFGKWLSAARRPHVDRILAVDELRWPFLIGLSKADPTLRIELKVS